MDSGSVAKEKCARQRRELKRLASSMAQWPSKTERIRGRLMAVETAL